MRRGLLPQLLVVRSDRLTGSFVSERLLEWAWARIGVPNGGVPDPPHVFDDPAQLLTEPTEESALLIVDAENVPQADVGILVRWRTASPGRRLAVLGPDGSAERLRRMGAPIDETLPWPLDGSPAEGAPARERDLSQIEAILGAGGPEGNENGNGGPSIHADFGPAGAHRQPNGQTQTQPQTQRAARRLFARSGGAPRSAFLPAPGLRPHQPRDSANRHVASTPDGDASWTERDPSSPRQRALDPDGPLLTQEELDAFFEPLEPQPVLADPADDEALGNPPVDAAEEFAEELAEDPADEPAVDLLDNDVLTEEPAGAQASGSARPAWLKRQIADLADLIQALELRARSNHAHVGMEAELARLRQFCKTLGLVASPPAHRNQRFDLAVHVEEQLSQLAGSHPDAPRILFRARSEDVHVEADKGLVACAVDALLQTALSCGGSGDVVRVQISGLEDALELDIEFPPGPLQGRPVAQILEPYGVRDLLPTIGANALAAAGAIVVGQGGELVLEEREGGNLAFVAELFQPRTAAQLGD